MTSTRSAADTGLPASTLTDPTGDYPEIYGMKCAGDCMAPEIPDSSKIAVSKSEAYGRGDLVVVWLWPEYVKPGDHQALVKRLAMGLPPWVTFPYKEHPNSDVHTIIGLSMNSMPGQMMMVPCAHIATIHPVIGIMKPGEKSYRRIVRPGALIEEKPVARRRAAAGRKTVHA